VLDRDVGPQRIILSALDLKDSELPSKLLERHQVGWTLLLPGLPAIAPLDQLPGWKRLYSDETVVFTSTSRLNDLEIPMMTQLEREEPSTFGWRPEPGPRRTCT
jgi:hypothetical protein